MLPRSVSPMAGISMATAADTRSWTLDVACRTLNWLWTCKWLNGISANAAASASEGLPAPSSVAVRCCCACAKLASSSFGASYRTASPWTNPSRTMMPRWTRAKKHRAVASTSYAASWASPNPTPKSFSWSSVNVGHLNLPPFPPGMAQNSVASFLESITALSVTRSAAAPRRIHSAPTMFTSNSTLWPMTRSARSRSRPNSSNTACSGCPSFRARSVVMPWTLAALNGMVNPSGRTIRLPRDTSLPSGACNCQAS